MSNSGIVVSRRELIAGVGSAALCGISPERSEPRRGLDAGFACAAPAVSSRGTFREKERDIPVDEWADVIVAGGGPAGIAAAVSAARAGKKVRLFELQGCLGGVWTAGLLSYIFDFDKSEIGWEIIRRLDALGARRIDRGVKYDLDRDWTYEPEYLKFVCEEMCRESGVPRGGGVSRRLRAQYRDCRHGVEVGAARMARQDFHRLHRRRRSCRACGVRIRLRIPWPRLRTACDDERPCCGG